MKTTSSFLISVILMCLCHSSAFAQHGATGGGSITESDLQGYMDRLDSYLRTPEGQDTFPEIRIHDHMNKESFHQILQRVYPVMQKEKPVDQFGIPRTCVGHDENNRRFFVCSSDDLPENTVAHQPSLYAIILHELFVQTGIEKPLSNQVPSEYKISTRIRDNLRYDNLLGWLPGKIPARSFLGGGIWCTDNPLLSWNTRAKKMTSRLLFWLPNGDFIYETIEISHAEKNSKHKIEKIFQGKEVIPTTMAEATYRIPLLPLRADELYQPLHERTEKGDFYIGVKENLLTEPAETNLGENAGIWNQVMVKAHVMLPSKPSEDALLECQPLGSFSLSPYASRIPGVKP